MIHDDVAAHLPHPVIFLLSPGLRVRVSIVKLLSIRRAPCMYIA